MFIIKFNKWKYWNLILSTKYKEKTELSDLQPLLINKTELYNMSNIVIQNILIQYNTSF